MNFNDKNPLLLPSGFQDILPEDAAGETRIVAGLLAVFGQHGYQQVKPPLVEFEESLFSGKGESLADNTFRVMDPISHRMMGIRADMTIQVARIAASRMKHKTRPLRLSYAGQVLRVKGEGVYAERQLSQAGIELIGDNTPYSDAETIIIALDALKKNGVKDISVDFSIPQLSRIIMDENSIKSARRGELLKFIEKKDISAIKSSGEKSAELFCDLIKSEGNAADCLRKLSALRISRKCEVLIENLSEIMKAVRRENKKVNLTVDPLERHGFEYHTGVSFSFFSAGSKEELGRGGRYKIDLNDEDAVGFTFSVNALKRSISKVESFKKLYIPYNITYSQSEKYRSQGYYTIHEFSESPDSIKAAKSAGCKFLLKNGKIISVD